MQTSRVGDEVLVMCVFRCSAARTTNAPRSFGKARSKSPLPELEIAGEQAHEPSTIGSTIPAGRFPRPKRIRQVHPTALGPDCIR